MDLFMRNVAWAASERQLTRSLADILHGPDFAVFSTSGAPLNFRVTLYSAKGQQRHNGIGVLTVPRRDVGQHFLALYGGLHPTHFVFVASRRILWTESNKPSRPDILEHVQRMPYQDPASIEHQERIHQEYATGTIRLKQVQFGWECRDLEPTFSSEYERDCVGSGSLQFQDDPREISVRVREPGQTRIIAISIGCISTISVGMVNREPVIFFSLLRPPVYEAETTAGTQNGLSDMDDLLSFFNSLGFKNMAPTLRKRHVSFDQGHADTACYTSLAIRLVCAGENDLRIFRQLSSTAGIAERLQHNPPQMEKRELFAARVRAQFASWLQTVDWPVAYHLEAVTRSWAVDLPEILSLRPEIDSFSGTYGSQETAILLRTFATEVRELFGQDVSDMNGMETVSQCFKRCKTEQIKNRPKATRVDRNTDDIFDCYHIVIVPTSHMMLGPHPERLNRVIRKYHRYSHHFIRVSFEDEGRLQYRFHREVDGPDFIRRRVGEVLKNLTIAGLPIEFLAYSQSALKEHSVWYLRPFYDDEARCVVNAKRVIKDLGNFHNLEYDPKMGFCPARYAARISQSFTSTESSISMEVEEVFIIDDIERNGSCFTDGVGTMSLEVSNEVNAQLYGKLRRRRRPLTKPRAYQIRLMGAKGMIAVDHKLSGRVVCVRRSMIKFDAPHSNDIEIAQAFDRPSRYYFNRPLIMLLEGLGVPYEVFEAYQRSAVQEVQDATHSLNRTARLLEGHGLGGSFRLPSVLQHLEQRLGIKQIPDPFYYRMQEFAVHHVLREMKHKARIPVPGGWILVGVADVHGYLGPREIFACTRCPDCRKDIYLEGPTMVSRSPTIHPGDVQVLQAIGRPPEGSPFASQPLKNCIVFSTEGERSLPSYLGGGDLDGDTYNVWSKSSVCKCTSQWEHLRGHDLLPPRANQEPAAYNPAPKKLVDHPCTMEDVQDFFVDYITSDVLGLVATNWLITADYSSLGIFDPDCYTLAQIHSNAVDYPKSGQPVQHTEIPKIKIKIRPDWHAPETISDITGKFYESTRAIGRLFRDIDLPALHVVGQVKRRQRKALQDGEERSISELVDGINAVEANSRDVFNIHFRLERHVVASRFMDMSPVTEPEVQDASDLFQTFSGRLYNACFSHSLSQARNAMLTEQELVVGTIVAKSSQTRKRKDTMAKMREETAVIVRDARDELKGDDGSTYEDWLRRAYVAWKLAVVEEEAFGAKSFWWVTIGAVFDALRALEEDERQQYDYP